MARKKLSKSDVRDKRIAISMTKSDYDVLKRFAEASKQTMSSVVSSTFAEMIPSFKELTKVLELSNKQKESAFDQLGKITADSMKKAHDANLLLSGAVSDALLNKKNGS